MTEPLYFQPYEMAQKSSPRELRDSPPGWLKAGAVMTESNIVNKIFNVNKILHVAILLTIDYRSAMHSGKPRNFPIISKGLVMKTHEYLDAARVKLNLPSDYALAKHLGISREYVSQFRLGKRPFSDDICIKIAAILEVNPLEIMVLAHAERSNSPEVKAVWDGLLKTLTKGFQSLLPHVNSGRRLALPR